MQSKILIWNLRSRHTAVTRAMGSKKNKKRNQKKRSKNNKKTQRRSQKNKDRRQKNKISRKSVGICRARSPLLPGMRG